MTVCLFICLFVGSTGWIFRRKREDGSWFNLYPVESDPEHHLETKQYKRSRYPPLLIIELF